MSGRAFLLDQIIILKIFLSCKSSTRFCIDLSNHNINIASTDTLIWSMLKQISLAVSDLPRFKLCILILSLALFMRIHIEIILDGSIN